MVLPGMFWFLFRDAALHCDDIINFKKPRRSLGPPSVFVITISFSRSGRDSLLVILIPSGSESMLTSRLRGNEKNRRRHQDFFFIILTIKEVYLLFYCAYDKIEQKIR